MVKAVTHNQQQGRNKKVDSNESINVMVKFHKLKLFGDYHLFVLLNIIV